LTPPDNTIQLAKKVKKWNPVSLIKKWWKAVKGICKKSNERSVVLKTTSDKIKEMNIKASLMREKTKVFKAAFIVYILVE
jgi:creatinine amidohydrolase/Fe(II)-dependent formamide hydrolase-like protein